MTRETYDLRDEGYLAFIAQRNDACKDCGIVVPFEEISKCYLNKPRTGSLKKYICKKCDCLRHKVRTARYTVANEERVKNGTQETYLDECFPDGRQCCQCKRVLPWSGFSVDLKAKHGRCHKCKDCVAYIGARKHHKIKLKKLGMTQAEMPMVSKEEYDEVYFGACSCCGQSPARGVDRIDSSLPYIAGNIQSMCIRDNRMKLDMSNEELFEACKQIYFRLREKKNGKKVKQEQTLFPL